MVACIYMGDVERKHVFEDLSKTEILDPLHFYAAYVFDRAQKRQSDVNSVVEQARALGYPVRYWWLSNAMDLQGTPDRLIVCVNHPSRSEETGMDLYNALVELQASWDDLEAAAVDEYRTYGRPLQAISGICFADGRLLFPPEE
jgi:hypothetical protein